MAAFLAGARRAFLAAGAAPGSLALAAVVAGLAALVGATVATGALLTLGLAGVVTFGVGATGATR